jgi:hypothetical protein
MTERLVPSIATPQDNAEHLAHAFEIADRPALATLVFKIANADLDPAPEIDPTA